MREPGLAGAVGRTQRRGAQRRDRGDVDDGAAAMLAHQRRRRLGAQERPGEVDREDAIPVLVRGVEQRREHRDPGIVDQRVEPAKTFAQRVHRRCHGLRIRDVAMQRQRVVGIGQAATAPRSNSPSMSSSATRKPSARKRFAVASPMPRAAPVTNATFDSLSFMLIRPELRSKAPYSRGRASCPGRTAAPAWKAVSRNGRISRPESTAVIWIEYRSCRSRAGRRRRCRHLAGDRR